MIKKKHPRSLRAVALRLLVKQLFIPLALLCVIILAGIAYYGNISLQTSQAEIVRLMANKINSNLDQAMRSLRAVAGTAESADRDAMSAFLKNTYEAYEYFDTVYYVDENDTIRDLYPYETAYIGFDASYIAQSDYFALQNDVRMSNPFISMRTGEPTVFLEYDISTGGYLVGELNLRLLQDDILAAMESDENAFIYVLDTNGTLLAHPSVDLVTQQTNMRNLAILSNDQSRQSMLYKYFGKSVVGTVGDIQTTGWRIVDQTEVANYIGAYAWILALVFLALMILCMTLFGNFQNRMRKFIVEPLEHLSVIVNDLTNDVASDDDTLSKHPEAFEELEAFAADFFVIRDNLQLRESALKASEE